MKDFFGGDCFLKTETAKRLYEAGKDLPIIDYHCHLSPKEIWEDREFENIGVMFLGGDHYKWRLMRGHGVREELITGGAGWKEKFFAYAETLATAAGNPLYHWTHMELKQFFGITAPLNPKTAEGIWEEANRVIREKHLSPRKCILSSNVEYLSTTDDPADSLEYHRLLAADASFPVRVTPAFRPDNLLQLQKPGYPAYIQRLSAAAGVAVTDLESLKAAIVSRLDAFTALGCRFTDVGIEAFPSGEGSLEEAREAFSLALAGENVDDRLYDSFLGHLYCFLAGEYKKRDLVMQWHIAVTRNSNTALYRQAGPDSGGDCIADPVPGKAVIRILDACEREGALPRTILYSLNPASAEELCSIAAGFRGVLIGAAWWFNDHKRGIAEQVRQIAELSDLSAFLGMLTDSRSFLSYARHDYFRRIFADILGGWIEDGEFADDENAVALIRAVYYENLKKLV